MIVLHRIDPILHYPIDPTQDPEKYMILFQSESIWPSKIVWSYDLTPDPSNLGCDNDGSNGHSRGGVW